MNIHTFKKTFLKFFIFLVFIVIVMFILRLYLAVNINEIENYITADGWTTVATSNDLLITSIEIYNYSDNLDELDMRVLDDNGAIIQEPIKIAVGEKILLENKMFLYVNNLTIQAKSSNIEGIYLLDIKCIR